MINAKRRSGLKGLKWFILALGLCILYAVSDEIHQLFVPGRGAQLRGMFQLREEYMNKQAAEVVEET